MSGIAFSGPYTAIAAAASDAFLRVYMSGGKATLAGAAQADCGTLADNVLTANDLCTIIPAQTDDVVYMVAGGTFAKYATLYAAAAGTVDDSGSIVIGMALEAATAIGDIVAVVRYNTAITGSVTRANITQDELQPYNVPLTAMKTHATLVALGAAAGTPAGDLGLTPGTFGSATPILIGEAASGNSKSDACCFQFALPVEYQAGESIKVRVKARVTTLATVSETIDCEVYVGDGAAGVSADICATNAQTVTATFVNYDFTITPTNRAAGDLLDIRLTAAVNDTGGTTGAIAQIGAVQILLDVQG